MKKTLLFIAFIFAIIPLLNAEENQTNLYEKKAFHSPSGDSIPYRILLPKDYSANKEYPLILFLHGAGERGYDNEAQLIHGSNLFTNEENRDNYPAIVIFPQCRPHSNWATFSLNNIKGDRFNGVYKWPSRDQELVIEMLNFIVNTMSVDKSRLYIMGLSMGAFGTYEILARHPHIFAAAVPICGGGNINVVNRYAKQTALWITHGDIDKVVPVDYSRKLHKALKNSGADVKYTEYKDVDHDSWTNTFNEPDLLKWLFSKIKNR